MLLYKLVDWLLPRTPDEAPYRWTLDWVRQESKTPFTAKNPRSPFFWRNDSSSCIKKVEDSMEKALEVISSGDWQVERIAGDDIIYAKDVQKVGKVFKFVGVINLPPEELKDQFFKHFEENPKWDINLKKVKVEKQINQNTILSHVIVSSAPLVSSRDLVLLMTWRRTDNGFVLSSTTVAHPDFPESPQYVRGEQKFCTYVLKSVPGCPNKCLVEWLMHTNLKGWLPQYVIDKTLSGGMTTHIKGLRSFAAKSKFHDS